MSRHQWLSDNDQVFFLLNVTTFCSSLWIRISSHSVAAFFTFLCYYSVDCGICFSVVSCPPIDFPSSLSFYFRSGVWPGLYFSLIPKRLCWQQMCGALQLGENETPPIFRDPVVFIQYCLTAVPSVPQVWDSRTLSSPCSCHCATGGYRLEKSQLIQLIGCWWGKWKRS